MQQTAIVFNRRKQFRPSVVAIHAALIAACFLMLFPLLFVLVLSFKEKGAFFTYPPSLIVPNPTFDSYVNIWSEVNLLTGFKNTLIVIAATLPLQLLSSALSAFAFAKLRFRGKNKLFMLILSTLMIPFPVTLIPMYQMFDWLGMTDSLLPLILPGTTGSVGVMFFLVQYMRMLPNELIESARLDGSGYFNVFARIILPLVKPALAAQAIFIFMGIWNNLLSPIIYISSESKYTLQYCLANLNSFYTVNNDYPMIMAGTVLSILPLILMFIAFQKYIIESLVLSGVKG